MRIKIAASGIKVFISVTSVLAFFPYNSVLESGIFVSLFVYLLSRAGECIFSLLDENTDISIAHDTIFMNLYFISSSFAAFFSWHYTSTDSLFPFLVLYAVCVISLFDDIVNSFLCAKVNNLFASEINNKKNS